MRADGTVKVLDFGLAKAMAARTPARRCRHGALADLHQSRRDDADGRDPRHRGLHGAGAGARASRSIKRADIWAFGVVVYEMLTGTRVFEGESIPETLGLIFAREPDLAALPAATPRRSDGCSRAAWSRIRSSACATSVTRG